MPVPPDFAENLQTFIEEWKGKPAGLAGEEYIGDNPFPHFVVTERAGSWQEYANWSAELDGRWCFRGQRETRWALATSMDRATIVEYMTANSSGHHHLDRVTEERELLQSFREKARHHVATVPASDDSASWLAMMQHYGVPTRLLDWTRSAEVGLYFALEEPSIGEYASLWSLDLDWLERMRGQLLPEFPAASQAGAVQNRIAALNRLLYDSKQPLIVAVDPPTTNDRMTAQQGILLFKTIDQATFSQMLMSMIFHGGVPPAPVIRKLDIPGDLRVEVLDQLRDRGIDSSTLFPGLAGFGKSLRTGLEIKVRRESDAAVREAEMYEAEYLDRWRGRRRAPTIEGT